MATVIAERILLIARATTLAVALAVFPLLAVAEPIRGEHIEVELVAAAASVQPDRPFQVALRLAPDSHWHTYWRNPGDSGLPTEIRWSLPPGSAAGPIQWPVPQRIPFGPLVNYGYDGEVLLLTDIRPPPTIEPGQSFLVTADVNWLVCEKICIPGEVSLSLELPVSAEPTPPNPRWQNSFETTRELIPSPRPGWQAQFEMSEQRLNLAVDAGEPIFDEVAAIRWFPIAEDIVANAAEQRIQAAGESLLLQQRQSDYFVEAPAGLDGVLVVSTDQGIRGFEFSAAPGSVGASTIATAMPPAAMPIGSALLAALAGGLILNLMPCVFPVLSIKALSLARGAHGAQRSRRLHGLAYTGGVVGSFLVVGLVLVLLRAAGHQLGWGFQLQSAAFVAIMAYLLFLLGLNLSGFFEISPQLSGAGQTLAERPGYRGSFFTGVLAVVVASPCTAPFMGTAMGFALTQTIPLALGVFVFLGIGMALPFLALSMVPGIVRWLPRPGTWMVRFKQLLAFPLYLTAVWLLWVLGRQTGVDGLALALCGLVLLVFAIWLWRQSGHWIGRGLAVVAMAAALALPLILRESTLLPAPASSASATRSAVSGWQPYSAARLQALRNEARPVFLNVTADWCITCLVNEQVALDSKVVRDRLDALGVVPLKGDWTRRDPELTALLAEFGRSGVPLYVLYPPGLDVEPVVLPQILTPAQVLAALDALERV